MSRVVVHDPARGDFPVKPGPHYQLSCYVCGPGCTKPSPFEGWATFASIFNSRPDGCRFAIARQLVLVQQNPASIHLDYRHAEEWVCWDLLDAGLISRAGLTNPLVRPPLPIWMGGSADALTMKAMALFDKVP